MTESDLGILRLAGFNGLVYAADPAIRASLTDEPTPRLRIVMALGTGEWHTYLPFPLDGARVRSAVRGLEDIKQRELVRR